MKKSKVNAIIEEAKKAGVEVSFYVWTVDREYRRGVHTDKIEYVCGTLTGMESLEEYDLDSYSIMDAYELNDTVYANSSESAEESEEEMIVMLEKIGDDNE